MERGLDLVLVRREERRSAVAPERVARIDDHRDRSLPRDPKRLGPDACVEHSVSIIGEKSPACAPERFRDRAREAALVPRAGRGMSAIEAHDLLAAGGGPPPRHA